MKALLLILLLTTTAFAQNQEPLTFDGWLFLDSVQNKQGIAQVFIDPASIQRDNDLVKAKARLTFPIGSWAAEYWKGSSAMPNFTRADGVLTFNCKKRVLKNGDFRFYDQSGQVAYVYRTTERVKEKQGGISWLAFEYLCERPQPKPTQKPVLKPSRNP